MAAPQAAESGDTMMLAGAMAMAKAEPLAEIALAQIESGGAAVTYRVARPVAVPSDRSPHRTTVTALDLGARLDYVTAPKIATEATCAPKSRTPRRLFCCPAGATSSTATISLAVTYLATIAPERGIRGAAGRRRAHQGRAQAHRPHGRQDTDRQHPAHAAGLYDHADQPAGGASPRARARSDAGVAARIDQGEASGRVAQAGRAERPQHPQVEIDLQAAGEARAIVCVRRRAAARSDDSRP